MTINLCLNLRQLKRVQMSYNESLFVMSVVNLHLCITNKPFSKYVRILIRIQVECSELGLRYKDRGFPGGTAVKNPPANAGNTGLSPGPGRSHMPQSNYAHAPQLLSLRSRAHEPQLLSLRATTTEACVPRVRALQQEKPPQ